MTSLILIIRCKTNILFEYDQLKDSCKITFFGIAQVRTQVQCKSKLHASAIGGSRRPALFALDYSSNQSSLVCLNVINKYHKYIMEIYVGNLPWSVNDQDLADAFKEYGTVDLLLLSSSSGHQKDSVLLR